MIRLSSCRAKCAARRNLQTHQTEQDLALRSITKRANIFALTRGGHCGESLNFQGEGKPKKATAGTGSSLGSGTRP